MSEPRPAGDHFSSVSAGYAAFRPRYPRALFEFVASIAPARRRAWDCGCGSGQATVDLAEWFDEVIATDVSAEQLEQAPTHPGITWRIAPAENVPIADGSIDAVTVAQALHWFDHERFYAEVRRVAEPRAAFAAWTYGSAVLEGPLGEIVSAFEHGTLKDYWPAERRFVMERYETIPFPFERIQGPMLQLEEDWNLAQVVGYLRTWSGVTRFVAERGGDPVAAVERELAASWGTPALRHRVVWPLFVIAGRIS